MFKIFRLKNNKLWSAVDGAYALCYDKEVTYPVVGKIFAYNDLKSAIKFVRFLQKYSYEKYLIYEVAGSNPSEIFKVSWSTDQRSVELFWRNELPPMNLYLMQDPAYVCDFVQLISPILDEHDVIFPRYLEELSGTPYVSRGGIYVDYNLHG